MTYHHTETTVATTAFCNHNLHSFAYRSGLVQVCRCTLALIFGVVGRVKVVLEPGTV